MLIQACAHGRKGYRRRPPGKHRGSPNRRLARQAWRFLAKMACIDAVVVGVGALVWWNPHLTLILGLSAAAVFCFVLGSAETYWRNYSWWTPDAMESFAWPSPVPARFASLVWSVVVPALNESANIEATINQLVRQDHPHFEVVVSLCACDTATIQAVKRAEAKYPDLVRSVIGRHREFRRHRKAYQLNRAIATVPTDDEHIVLIADAEGGVQPTLLRHMEAVFKKESCDVVQGGVQLMNLGRWFQVFAAMEYAAWFEGNMARQANQGVVLFGGNTVAFTTSHLAQIDGIPDSLTEDGAAGIRSAMVGAKVAVCYSPELCTRELSPPTLFNRQLGSLFFQRVRWVQGYFHEFVAGHWLKLPTWSQRRSAAFGLASPVLQSVSSFLLPLAIVTALMVKVPLILALAAFVPLVPYSLTIWAQAMHLGNFGRRFQQKVRLRHYLTIIFLSPLYQVILMSASAVAVCRHLTGRSDWYKTGREHDLAEIVLTGAQRAAA